MNTISNNCFKVSKDLTIQLFSGAGQEHQMQKNEINVRGKLGKFIKGFIRALLERGLVMYLLTIVCGLISLLIL